MAYQSIDGVQYEKSLLDLAIASTSGKGEGKISKEEVDQLFKSASDGQGITDTEKRTLGYIRKTYPFTPAAAEYFDSKLSKN